MLLTYVFPTFSVGYVCDPMHSETAWAHATLKMPHPEVFDALRWVVQWAHKISTTHIVYPDHIMNVSRNCDLYTYMLYIYMHRFLGHQASHKENRAPASENMFTWLWVSMCLSVPK